MKYVERVYSLQALLEFIAELQDHHDRAKADGSDRVRLIIEGTPKGHVLLGQDELEPEDVG